MSPRHSRSSCMVALLTMSVVPPSRRRTRSIARRQTFPRLRSILDHPPLARRPNQARPMTRSTPPSCSSAPAARRMEHPGRRRSRRGQVQFPAAFPTAPYGVATNRTRQTPMPTANRRRHRLRPTRPVSVRRRSMGKAKRRWVSASMPVFASVPR